jgi:predicted DNA-binding transcriptional regulator AlpA
MQSTKPDFVRVRDIVSNKKTGRAGILSIGKSLGWKGVREGRFPAPTRLPGHPHLPLWRRADVEALLADPVEVKGGAK